MNFWDYLDRAGERRARRPLDIRAFIGLAFLFGYYFMVVRFMSTVIPEGNLPLVRDAMLVLGPAVGLIVGAIFRSDLRDEQAAAGNREAWRAVGKQADATTAAAQAGTSATATTAADAVADAAVARADEIKGT